MSNRIFCYDTEFLDDGRTIELISIGIVSNLRDEYYAVNVDCDFDRIRENQWLWANVCPHLPTTKKDWTELKTGQYVTQLDRSVSIVKPKWVIANEVRDFITGCIDGGDRPWLWADHGAYDHVALAQLFGPMIKLPAGMPMFTSELQQLLGSVPGTWKPPRQVTANEHHALNDARHTMRVYQAAMDVLRETAHGR